MIELKPTPCFEKKSPDEKHTLGRLANKSPSLFKRQLLLFVLCIFTLITMLASPTYVQQIIDEAINRSD
ncbi:hypothetical protein, partial [Enterobacter hormaechei]|uniref:hypothetical protein n=1 Tax=Enterobacter hormaechei TaxID=158836 RepID=UPI001EF38E1F